MREVEAKSTPTDLVSEADLEAERAIREMLAARRPDDAILGEEGDDVAGSTGLRWVVDPLDGTINYLFGIPQWCVSVACEGRVGVVLDPLRDELSRRGGRRALLDGEPLRGRRDDVATAMVATGFGYDARVRARRPRSWRACCRRCATSAASARPRSTSRGWPPGATTPTTSTASCVGLGGGRDAVRRGRPRDPPPGARGRLPPGILRRRRPPSPARCSGSCVEHSIVRRAAEYPGWDSNPHGPKATAF